MVTRSALLCTLIPVSLMISIMPASTMETYGMLFFAEYCMATFPRPRSRAPSFSWSSRHDRYRFFSPGRGSSFVLSTFETSFRGAPAAGMK
jgi:hypothetical protein